MLVNISYIMVILEGYNIYIVCVLFVHTYRFWDRLKGTFLYIFRRKRNIDHHPGLCCPEQHKGGIRLYWYAYFDIFDIDNKLAFQRCRSHMKKIRRSSTRGKRQNCNCSPFDYQYLSYALISQRYVQHTI